MTNRTLTALAGLTTLAATLLSLAGPAQARDQIRIVGSSTVFPFATAVAEEFGKTTEFATPIVEATGSGGGLKLLCSGVGVDTPDIANASRRIKQSEVDLCAENGVEELIEIKVGYDGIVLANSKTMPLISFDLRSVWLALAKEVPVDGKLVPNPYSKWSEIDPTLPDVEIEVLGPPPTSGTRDAFVELAMEGGCQTFPEIAALKKEDANRYKSVCHSVREDGLYKEAGENDNLIVQRLQKTPTAFGIFGFSFLDQNADVIQGNMIDGIAPTFGAIGDGAYTVSRSLYFYVKKAHVDTIPGIREYLEEFTSEKASGDFGYLTDKGLIPMPDTERRKTRSDAENLTPLNLDS